ncbi:MAG: flagellar motor stator protein MotA [Candidatus Dactylopiibacterium carminicum]|uniref:Flagellar motor stator protein MotA n=1 Tax=Candidatus Dactylopiibacterium carminicum TaxID=857335 RepID=A0A272EWG0_9RHOO|nr:flagellar motor stator protein MotA [Candidatus Dactylopiibacterium carminicum]KAF7599962.1 flagellar motor stator protein MotA [Candidatus Dactylopiibacterium carminicum]PAS94457.1 MAG: flagellar motor stator protein MotA [Candidatus Dactylopiibacterium carminicum]PAS97058.1 MAG: flagellar motor stator protein MotA [Candidatus Dactylopiibacterium carminicum]PAS99965.1 MAG: flagellar motor stator protein MotA [Candidatus Dactylopiibacterium carminicum]
MQQILGIVIVLLTVFGGFMLGGGILRVIWEPVELIIICGAAVGALVLGNPRHVLAEMWLQLKQIITMRKNGAEYQRQLLLLMYELLQTAAGGLKALDAHVEEPHKSPLFQRYPLILKDPKLLHFIVDNFRLMAMGKINAHELEGVLDQELEAIHEELAQPAKSLQKIAEAMPGFGILAAVLGIVMAMNTVGEGANSAEIAERVAAAMVGTFIGIFFCYGVLDPISNVMNQVVTEEISALECVKVVLVTHVAGKPALLAIDAGRRLVQLNIKPSFAELEGWINAMNDEPIPARGGQRG